MKSIALQEKALRNKANAVFANVVPTRGTKPKPTKKPLRVLNATG